LNLEPNSIAVSILRDKGQDRINQVNSIESPPGKHQVLSAFQSSFEMDQLNALVALGRDHGPDVCRAGEYVGAHLPNLPLSRAAEADGLSDTDSKP